jgi:hypothetical protein
MEKNYVKLKLRDNSFKLTFLWWEREINPLAKR